MAKIIARPADAFTVDGMPVYNLKETQKQDTKDSYRAVLNVYLRDKEEMDALAEYHKQQQHILQLMKEKCKKMTLWERIKFNTEYYHEKALHWFESELESEPKVPEKTFVEKVALEKVIIQSSR